MKWIAFILALPFLPIVGGLLLNRPPLLAPPGPLERLKTYFTSNVAETRLDHEFPELRPPLVLADAVQTKEVVLAAIRSLGWGEVRVLDGEVRAVVISPLLGFRDDVVVRLEAAGRGTLLHARSASRVGKGDLAANARYLQMLFGEVRRLAGAP